MKTEANIETGTVSGQAGTVATAVDVIDAAGGNVGSLCRALERLGVEYRRVNASNRQLGDRPIILPGVGAFGAVMANLEDSKLVGPIKEAVAGGVQFLGICVGLQVLFDDSEESPGVAGLSILPGKIVRFTQGKIPQIGWNSVESTSPDWPSGFVYFVNSYFAQPTQPDAVLFKSEYFQTFCAAVQKDNITAFQFHPEKSGEYGMTLLKRWLINAGI
jgi:imidazole glycerol phosphate synthase glutamine amidotransferase subunit